MRQAHVPAKLTRVRDGDADGTGIVAGRTLLAPVLRLALPFLLAMVPVPALAQPAVDAEAEVLPGVARVQLDPGYWIARLVDADRMLLDPAAVATQNARMRRLDPSLHDIEQLPPTLEAGQVRAWIEAASPRPSATLYDESGHPGSPRAIDKLVAALD